MLRRRSQLRDGRVERFPRSSDMNGLHSRSWYGKRLRRPCSGHPESDPKTAGRFSPPMSSVGAWIGGCDGDRASGALRVMQMRPVCRYLKVPRDWKESGDRSQARGREPHRHRSRSAASCVAAAMSVAPCLALYRMTGRADLQMPRGGENSAPSRSRLHHDQRADASGKASGHVQGKCWRQRNVP